MGSGRDKRKKQKGKKPGLGEEKTERKTEKNQQKAQRRNEKAAKGGEDDIDALLAAFKLQDAAATQVVVKRNAPAPSARTCASCVAGPPLKGLDTDVIMYGGEWYDGQADKVYVYSDLYVYHTAKDAWTHVVIPKGPLPRTAHQAVMHRSFMYVFGGEFTSHNQERFRHYNDTWRLDVQNWQWEQLPQRGSPSARSGHRMVVHKGRIILFGGFLTSGQTDKFYNDTWEYSLEDLKWASVGSPNGLRPPPRGGCQLAVHGDTMFMVGGYSVAYDEDGGERGVIHDDVWALDLNSYVWERVKKAGLAPGPRSSFGMAVHRNRAILFGGVSDQEGKGDKMYSELHNELYQFNMESRRWYPLALRPPAKNKGAADGAAAVDGCSEAAHGRTTAGAAGDSSGVASEMSAALQQHANDKHSPFYKAALRIQAQFRGYAVRKAYKTYRLGGTVSELLYSPATYGIDVGTRGAPKPRARTNPMMAVVKNKLWTFGGIVEIAHTDVTLDDLWCLDLGKLDGWQCIKENSAGEDAFKDMEFSDEEEGSSDGEITQ